MQEADKFAGFILYKLGASITEVKQCYSNLPRAGSSTHPPKSARIAAVSSGYYDAKRIGASVERTTSSINTPSRNTNVGATVRIGRLEVMIKKLGWMDNKLGWMTWEDAKKACEALGDGWRLPTKDELNILYENMDKIGITWITNSNCEGAPFWSSTDAGGNFAWIQFFCTGKYHKMGKDNRVSFRAVRSI